MHYLQYRLLILMAVVGLLTLNTGFVQAADAGQIMEKSNNAVYYAADDGSSRVEMKLINKRGDIRLREFTILRKDVSDGGEQKYFIYFHKPNDVRNMTFMVNKYADKNDDRWLYIPAIHMVKRISANDKTSSFVGSDFSYEDISGRALDDDTHEFLGEETVAGRQCYVIKNTPKESGISYAYRKTFVDKESYLIIKDEYYKAADKLYKVFTADKIETHQGYPTAVKRTMKNVKTGHHTSVSFSEVKYNIGLTDKIFSERSMRRPPKKWIK